MVPLWLCFGAVHGPFTPAERHRGVYARVDVPVPSDILPPRPGKPDWVQKIACWEPGPDGIPVMAGGAFGGQTVEGSRGIYGNTLTDWVRQYHEGVLALDESVGRLVSALKESGQYDNTLIVFTSDQGFAWGQHGFCTRLAPYDATIRSPLIVGMPTRLPSGTVVKAPVAGVDLVPTFFAFAGIALPWKMHGHDLTPLLRDPDAEWNHPAMTVFTARTYGAETSRLPPAPEAAAIAGVPWYVMLRHGPHKYIRYLVEGEIEELYNLESDPDELHNLSQTSAVTPVLNQLREATLSELRRTDAGFVDSLPQVPPASSRQVLN